MRLFVYIALFSFAIIIVATFAPKIFAGCQCGNSGRANESCVPNKEQCGEGKFACCWPDPPQENPAPENRENNTGCNPGEWGPCGCGGNPNNSNYCNSGRTWECKYNPGTCGPGAGSNNQPAGTNVVDTINIPNTTTTNTNTTTTTNTTNTNTTNVTTNNNAKDAICATQSQGDADCDGKITLRDTEQLRLELNGTSTKKADFNNDTRIDLLDISIWMRNYAAKYTI